LGATLAGVAGPFLKAADHSLDAVRQVIWELTSQLRIAMFASGTANIDALQQAELLAAK
jgi:isopentenyl-diphosphate delta-isomerase